jgi:aryl-alcohol dehydrogenase-like predicted oxidoreductase
MTSTEVCPSDIGYGAYRVEQGVKEHLTSLELFLSMGGELIDTAGNYTSGGSERLIGEVLQRADGARVSVVTKAGYLEPEVESHIRDGLRGTYAEQVDTPYGFANCIHPSFLADALERSLARLRVPRVDAFLLHNPEYFLTTHIRSRQAPIADLRARFTDRLRAAFAYLEEQVAAGHIGSYGVSSNHIGLPDVDPLRVQVEELLAIAAEVNGAHHLTTIQCPFNLLERAAALPSGPRRPSPFEVARAAGLRVMTNRPINASRGTQVQLRDGRSTDVRSELFLDALKRALTRAGYERLDTLDKWSLAHAALDIARSLPCTTTVLNGMRRPAYVRIAFEVMRTDPIPDARQLIEKLY